MKLYKLMMVAFSILLINIAVFGGEDTASQEKTKIDKVITTYVKSIDTRNTTNLSNSVISNGTFIVINDIRKMDENYSSNQLIDLVKNGQKGGWLRKVAINSVNVKGNTAVANVDITDSRLKESGFITLVNENGNWKIVSEVATLQLNK